jgi:glycosyltransferase involved in cell wall biosynthesis
MKDSCSYDLSVIIPARSEEFLKNTVEDILRNKRGKTEVIVILDGKWANPALVSHPDLTILYTSEPYGQREATNQGVRLSQAKYVMKCDAHCAFDEGFDVKMIDGFKEVGDDVTMVPMMYNLHVFDWKCMKCGNRWYMGPAPHHCMKAEHVENPNCDNTTDFTKRMVWKPRLNRRTDFWMFDSEPHFQYFNGFKARPESQGKITETMSLIGACFMLTRERYWKLNICDKDFGSWGSQGIEVACKSWLSGGRLMVNKNTWFAHCFRTQKDFGFPYPQSNTQVQKAKQRAKEMFFKSRNNWQVLPLSWLVEKFLPLPGWSEDDVKQLKEIEKSIWSEKELADIKSFESTPKL